MTLKAENIPIKRWWDYWNAFLITSAVVMVAGRLWTTEWAKGIYVLVFLSFFAVLTGLALGYSHFSPFFSTIISTLYGIFFTGWLFGGTVDMTLGWRNRILLLGWRLRFTTEQFLTGRTITDPILFLTILAALVWILGSLSAFIIIRKGSAWPGLLSLGITLLVIGHYDPNIVRNTRFLMTFIFFGLLMLGRMTFLHLKNQWHEEGIGTPTDMHSDLFKTLVIVTIILLTIAWVIPVTPHQVKHYSELWENITDAWDRMEDRIPDLITITREAPRMTAGTFGDTLGLGSGSPPSVNILFSVRLETEGLEGYRNYWRARSYDTYQDGDWSTSPQFTEKMLFPESFDIQYATPEVGQVERYLFTSETARIQNLFAPGQPLWVNRPVIALTQPISETEEDPVALVAEPAIASGDTYRVETRVHIPTVIELKSTSQDYPEWLNPYLQLPEDFSQNIATLARTITDIYTHPYDKAAAITQYLRQNIEYSRTIPNRPKRVDPIEWFLFDIKTGFCNYYATAQVLMLRSLGIPARLGVGYAQGEYDTETESFIIRRLDSHAWPEVYFVGVGWVIFEPTTDQPRISLPTGEENIDQEGLPILPDDGRGNQLPGPDFVPPESIPKDDAVEMERGGDERFNPKPVHITWIIFTLFIIGLFTAIYIRYRPSHTTFKIDLVPVIIERTLIRHHLPVPNWLRKWRYRAQMSAPEKAYRQLGWSLRILGGALDPAETPSERAQRLTKLLPLQKILIQEILNEYHLDQFSHHHINEERAKDAARKVRTQAVMLRIRKMLQFPKRIAIK